MSSNISQFQLRTAELSALERLDPYILTMGEILWPL